MFKRAPEQMYRALTLHNNVIRHAKYVNCGSIIQQEGDSFTLAFHTAFDAVAFCLQVSGSPGVCVLFGCDHSLRAFFGGGWNTQTVTACHTKLGDLTLDYILCSTHMPLTVM
jgi:hypothetical protein